MRNTNCVSTSPLFTILLLLISLPAAVAQDLESPHMPPTVIAFGNAPGWITVAYNHASPDGVLWYVVERRGGGSAVLFGSDGTWTDVQLTPDTTYAYHVCAIYGSDDEPACSGWVEARTLPPPGSPADFDPPIIRNIQVSPRAIQVTWGETGDYTRILARIEDAVANSVQLDVQNIPNSSVTFDGLRPSTPYKVLLKGCSSRILLPDSCGPWSPEVFMSTASLPQDPPPPQKPSLRMTGFTETSISLQFSVKLPRANASDRFHIFRDGNRIQEVFPTAAVGGWSGSYTDNVQASQRHEHQYSVCFEGHSPRADVCSTTVRLIPAEAVTSDTLKPGPSPGRRAIDSLMGR